MKKHPLIARICLCSDKLCNMDALWQAVASNTHLHTLVKTCDHMCPVCSPGQGISEAIRVLVTCSRAL